MIYPVAEGFIYKDTQFKVYASDSNDPENVLEVNVSAVIWFGIKLLKWVHFNHTWSHWSADVTTSYLHALNSMHQKKLDLRNSLKFSSSDSWIKIDQLDITCFIISLFNAQQVSNVRMLVHPSSGACDLFVELFHGLYCSGSMCVGVMVWFGWGGVVSLCRLRH